MSRTWGLWILPLLCLVMIGASPVTTAPAIEPAKQNAVVIAINGEINEYTQTQLTKRLADAKQLGAKVVILQIDTYGGLVSAGLEMSALLKRQTDLHIVAFVPEKAISAGAMIAMACDEIVMGPSAKMGDSAPISVGNDGALQPLPETERAKFESPILEDFRDSAIRHGYDPLLAESMVSVGRTVYWLENAGTGNRRFVNQAEYDKLTAGGEWKPVAGVRNPIDPANELLTVSTDLAVKLGLAKGIANDANGLANDRGYTIIATFAPTAGETFLRLFGSAAVRSILFTIFLMSLYAALHAPGHGAPEAIVTICLGLLIGVPMLTGYAQWWEVAMILMGVVFLALEIFVIPGFGVAGISGIALILIGFLLTFVPKEPDGLPGFLPSLAGTWTALRNGLIVIVSGMAASLILSAWLRKYMPHLPFFNKLILTTAVGDMAPTLDPIGDRAWPSLGDRGKALTDLRPGGSAQFSDASAGDHRVLSVVSDRGFVIAGTELIVQEVGGGRVVVRPVSS